MTRIITGSAIEHSATVSDCFNLWTAEDNSLEINTRDKKTILAPSKLIAFYSPQLFAILTENGGDTMFVEDDFATLVILLDLLKTGEAISGDKDVILQVIEAGESLGINLENITYCIEEQEGKNEKTSSYNMSTESFLMGFNKTLNKNNIDEENEFSKTNEDCTANMSIESFIEKLDTILEGNSLTLQNLEKKHVEAQHVEAQNLETKNLEEQNLETKNFEEQNLETKNLEVRNLETKYLEEHYLETKNLEETSVVMMAKTERIYYDCETCGKSFHTKNKLSRHSLCHTSVRCNICHKGFRFISLLNRHMKTEHGEDKHEESSGSENETLKEQVDEGSESKLKENNIDTYDPQLQKPLECGTCGKAFTSTTKLSHHTLCHTNYKCSFCSKGFRMSSMLQRHVSTIHREQFKCKLCEKNFATSTGLRKHTLNRHSIVHVKTTLIKENLVGLKPVLV